MLSTRTSTSFRADWLAARASLATRRLRPYVAPGLAVFALAVVGLLLLRGPFAGRSVATAEIAARSVRAAQDTMPLSATLQAARTTLAARDSAMQALAFAAEARTAIPALSIESQRAVDSLNALVVTLDSLLDRSNKAPLAASYRALAATRTLRPLASVRALVDSLDRLDRMRLALDPALAPQSELAQLTQRANGIGASLQALARAHRAALNRRVESIERAASSMDRSVRFSEDTILARLARDSARDAFVEAESALRERRRQYETVQQHADSVMRTRSARTLGASPVNAVVAAFILVSVLAFTLAVAAEVRHPTIAHARETERLTGVPVLAVERDLRVPREGRARLQPGSGVDPFRQLYLALTASGIGKRTICVTGDDAATVAVVAGRLSVSAAVDEQATLLVDLSPGAPRATRYFTERTEPGFTEAIVGIRLWREVALSVGASEELGIDVVPAGAPRPDSAEAVSTASNRNEFHLFANEYDFAVMAAPAHGAMTLAAALLPRPTSVYVARVAATPLSALAGDLRALAELDVELYGILLVDWSNKDANATNLR